MLSDQPNVFISYSHADEAWKDRLVKQLKVLQLEDVLEVWDDRQIAVGDDWQPEIVEAIERARVAVFMVSADSLTSKFIREKEIPPILERRGGELRVIPIIVRPCAWDRVSWLASIQSRPKDGADLLSMTDAEAETALSELVKEIADLLAAEGPRLEPRSPAPQAGPRISISRLPATGKHFVAREDELANLDDAWSDPATNVISFVAMGGAGKSALVNRWLGQLQTDGWRGAERIFGWSFYSQGTDAAGASSEPFTEEALDWLGYEGETITSPWKKGEVIARLVRERRTLLLLDGLEPLQHPPGAQTGRLKDPAMQALVKALAAGNQGLCVISTRLAVDDIAGRVGTVAVDLEKLAPVAGAELLRQLGVKGPDTELKEASEEFGGHGLALTLLGTYLRDVCDGDVRRRKEVPLLDDDTKPGRHARRVMEYCDLLLAMAEPEDGQGLDAPAGSDDRTGATPGDESPGYEQRPVNRASEFPEPASAGAAPSAGIHPRVNA